MHKSRDKAVPQQYQKTKYLHHYSANYWRDHFVNVQHSTRPISTCSLAVVVALGSCQAIKNREDATDLNSKLAKTVLFEIWWFSLFFTFVVMTVTVYTADFKLSKVKMSFDGHWQKQLGVARCLYNFFALNARFFHLSLDKFFQISN